MAAPSLRFKGAQYFLFFRDFHRGEPNNPVTEKCAEINRYSDNAKWNDVGCSYKLSVLCDFSQPSK